MGKYRIYKKSEKFVWTRARILLGLICVIALIYGVQYLVSKDIVFNLFNKALFVLLCLCLALGLINNFLREELKGKLQGNIIFEKEKITIENIEYCLTDIRLIKFYGYDYVDMVIANNFPDSLFSSGVNNNLTIILDSGIIISTNFQRNHESDMRKIIFQLNYYYEEGKMIKENYLKTINEKTFY